MILLIGANSFIGAYTVDALLSHGYKVAVTARKEKFREYYEKKNVDFYKLDLTNELDFEKLPKKDVECVILLAGLLPANVNVDLDIDENAADYFRINTIGTINVLEYCRKNNIKRVISNCSYADVCKSWGKGYPITEEEPRGFLYKGDHAVYVFSKNAANDVLEYYNQQHGMKNAIFRFPPVYGVGPHGSLYVNGHYKKSGMQIFIEKAEKGEPITIYGDPQLSRDVIYVKDVAEAYCLACNSEKTYGLYNMTSGVPLTLQKQVETIIEVFSKDKKSEIYYDNTVNNNTPSYLYSMKKAKDDFGFVPKYSDFRDMMIDYKKDLENKQYREIFEY